MRALRLFAIMVVFASATVAWMVLGGIVWARTERLDTRLSGEMRSLWGPKVLTQLAPYWTISPREGRGEPSPAAPSASRIVANIRHDQRYKGLLWYSTFSVDFDASYTVPPAAPGNGTEGFFVFSLPTGVNGYDNLSAAVNGKPQEVRQDQVASGRLVLPLDLAAESAVSIRYTTDGQDVWVYAPGEAPNVTGDRESGYSISGSAGGRLVKVSNFSLRVNTDFRDVDYLKGARSPSTPVKANDGGVAAEWQLNEALTSQPIGIVMPCRRNAGPLVARMSFFAPVSLLFFFTVLFTLVVLKAIPLHPMHYLFISAGFFAFHILMAYLADIVTIHAAFWICAAVSVLLVVSYMRLVAGVKFAVTYVGLAQLVYLVGFSYAFFWERRTGLAVTVGAILTLFVLMQATGRVKWHEVFTRETGLPIPPPGGRPTQ